jgi:hypothetical protein
MSPFRHSYLGHRSTWKLNMARFEESKDGPFNWYIETWVLKKSFSWFTEESFEKKLERVLNAKRHTKIWLKIMFYVVLNWKRIQFSISARFAWIPEKNGPILCPISSYLEIQMWEININYLDHHQNYTNKKNSNQFLMIWFLDVSKFD